MELNSEDQKFSYGLGQSVGQNFLNEGFDKILDIDAFMGGFSDAFGGQSALSHEEINQVLQKKIGELKEGAHKGVKEEGEKFLKENATKTGVTTLASGLQYEVIESGDTSASKPGLSSQVTTHYTGQLINGQVFDSSVQRGQPATFPVGGVIAGWTEALQLMVPGDKWRLYIPQNLAYGERGAGRDIPPFAALIFDIELISVS
ncbi:FKBP-type peptidyl-prolyl cis-trans isomerase [Reichenbachiella agarivorans]|uniref:Peptidyl-prolyl cis-trans isomerase n=1 Tax=Reichenbachiella agarivorans TaxID=2979464 RepID=A0ABY6CS48_9BACT|nr:FKBP-type peptidyl-prolyl cis-trans isomerase [Reichenbachiella agarivorans]UXP32273.1 FKBP-type peptidyl-prolyl cis-trans isomerase [Reichenbachiella agarivorans]